MRECHDLDVVRRSQRRTLLAGAFMLFAFPALALDVRDCRDAGVGIESIVTPIEGSHIALYNGKVDAYTIDTIEPACCSSGIAVVLPAKGDPFGGNHCRAVIGLTAVDVKSAMRSYDKVKGLLLVMPTKRSKPNGDAVVGPPLKLRINLGEGTVTLE